MISTLLKTTDKLPEDASDNDFIIALLNFTYRLLKNKGFSDDMLNGFVMSANAVFMYFDVRKNYVNVVPKIVDILTQMNLELNRCSLLTDEEKDMLAAQWLRGLDLVGT